MTADRGGDPAPGRGWSRREFLRAAAAAGWLGALGAARPGADGAVRIGLVAPAAGAFGPEGEAIRRGVRLGAEEASRTAQLFDRRLELAEAAADTPAAAAREAARLVRERHATVLVGGADEAGARALAEAADRHGVLFLNAGCADDALRGAACRRSAFHVAASAAMYTDALADGLVTGAGLERWYFVTSGSEASAALRRRAQDALRARGGEERGAAVLAGAAADPRALLADVQRSEADVLYTCLAGAEQLRLLRRYREASPGFQVAGPLLETIRLWDADPAARAGTWPTMWYHERKPFGASSLSARFQERFGRAMDPLGWAGWLAVKVAWEAALRAGTNEPAGLAAFLEGPRAEFDGHKGVPLGFRPWDHQLRQPLYLVRARTEIPDRWDVFEVVAELPRAKPGEAASPRELLDRLGDDRTRSRCSFPRGEP
ncbi:MAG TPA: ABC transporter substrate-binding protein [Longimicrobiales bacterium]|nr:ABC transporter substrate-binding protein [Longimicrobiales bacterium]